MMQFKIGRKKIKARVCKGLSIFRGFMFTFDRTPRVLCFGKERKVSLHSFFVFFPLKIYFLDGMKRVVETVRMRPFSFYVSKKKASYVLEVVDT